MKEYYTINDISLMTGLTTRTIRNYIRQRILDGEKANGVWQFPHESLETFLEHPAIQPKIQAKKNAVVYDFLLDKHKKSSQICVILDLPDEKALQISDFFASQCNSGKCGNEFHFSFEYSSGYSRAILKGQTEVILELLNNYYQTINTQENSHEI